MEDWEVDEMDSCVRVRLMDDALLTIQSPSKMLMVNAQPRTPALGNFYFSPVRLRPVFEPAYFEEPRAKRTDSNLDLSLEVKPKFRHGGGNSKIHSTYVENDEEDEDALKKKEKEKEKREKQKREKEKKEKERKKKEREKEKKKSHHKDEEDEESKADMAFQHLCSKLRVSFVLGALGVLVLLACCCALFLRNRIAACCRRCWPCRKKKKKGPSKANLFDVEEGEYPYQTSRKSPFKKSKKNKNPPRLIDTGTQDSRTTMARAQEEPPTPVGCSPCCKKKKRRTSKKRRK